VAQSLAGDLSGERHIGAIPDLRDDWDSVSILTWGGTVQQSGERQPQSGDIGEDRRRFRGGCAVFDQPGLPIPHPGHW